MNGLQGEAAEDEDDAEGAQAALGKIVCVVFDERIDGDAYASDYPGYQANANRKYPCVVDVMDEGTADKRGDGVADGSDNRAPKLAAREAWSARGGIVSGGTHAARIGEDLAGSYYDGKGDGEVEAQVVVQSGAERETTDSGKQSFPWQGVRRKTARGAVELNREGDTSREARSQAEEETQAQAVANAKNDGVGYYTGKQAQRAALTAEKIVGEVEATQHIETGANDAESGEGVVVHWKDYIGEVTG